MERAEPAEPSRRKATWFCQTCGHESPIDGDWVVQSAGDRETTDCPECGTRIDERPSTGSLDSETGATGTTGATRLVKAALAPVYASLTMQYRVFDPRHS